MAVYLFTEIEDAIQKWQKFPEEMEICIETHDEIIKRNIKKYGGRIIKHSGDGVLAVFEEGEALLSSFYIQYELQNLSFKNVGELKVRVGINSGESFKRILSKTFGDAVDYLGISVSIAARIMSIAWGGQILFTNDVLQSCKLPQGAKIKNLGNTILRNIETPVEIFQIIHPKLKYNDFPLLRTSSDGSEKKIKTIIKEASDELKTLIKRGYQKDKIAYLLNPITQEEFPLYEGQNTIGRKGNCKVDIDLINDKLVSRLHALIKVEKNEAGNFAVSLTDNGELNNGEPSTNGVYINNSKKRVDKKDVVVLNEGDCVLIGETKLIFGFEDDNELVNLIF